MGLGIILLSKKTSKNDNFRVNITLVIQDLTGQNISLDDFVKISEDQIKTLVNDGQILENRRFLNNSFEFHELLYTGKQGVFELMWKQYYTINNEKAYILTLTTGVEQFESYKTVGEEIMNSFKLK
jgi:serine/threonine-protein kinase